LSALATQSETVKASLHARRDVLAEVLAALQRMGLKPPPAILVRPDDALSSVRSAILLGAVVPEMRAETVALADDLKRLTQLAEAIRLEKENLRTTLARQAEEQTRLASLVTEKQALQETLSAASEAERARATELAASARSLKGLIAAIERDIESARVAAEQEARARAEEEIRLAEGRKRAQRDTADAARMAPQQPFSALKASLNLPATGHIVTAFGADDGFGASLQGDRLETRTGAIVTAPADGWVLYAGPFRSYGQLLILNAGDDYHVVLAGMDRVNVELGQFVLAGEPVGVMGSVRVASAAPSGDNGNPALYIEFRKNGTPVDPGPWWRPGASGRTHNDT
ncbi:MAG TPA: peptidoglycan DD-metalloendopeptidase family protein, partial [Rhizobiaceae bacterium]|nr:peptidoglycan DD-metalloendopeptidase family protein [Rhizobiaceae bacterium]